MNIRIHVEETSNYFNSLERDIKKFHLEDVQEFGIRVSCLQKALINAFADLGYREDIDYKVGWDWDASYLVYGTLINKGMIRPSLVGSILKVFSSDNEPNDWVCLLHVEKKNALVGSQFYIKANGDIVIEKDIEWYEIERRLSGDK